MYCIRKKHPTIEVLGQEFYCGNGVFCDGGPVLSFTNRHEAIFELEKLRDIDPELDADVFLLPPSDD